MSKRADREAATEEESKLQCKKPNCANGRHSYLAAPKREHKRREILESAGMAAAPAIAKPFEPGTCWACGDQGVPWNFTHSRDPARIEELIAFLAREEIRHHYWHKAFDEKAVARARKEGREGTTARVQKRLLTAIGHPANGFDGRQTPWEGDVICYAQHATATCCRHCVARWYGIPADKALDHGELSYLVSVAVRFLELRASDVWGGADHG